MGHVNWPTYENPNRIHATVRDGTLAVLIAKADVRSLSPAYAARLKVRGWHLPYGNKILR